MIYFHCVIPNLNNPIPPSLSALCNTMCINKIPHVLNHFPNTPLAFALSLTRLSIKTLHHIKLIQTVYFIFPTPQSWGPKIGIVLLSFVACKTQDLLLSSQTYSFLLCYYHSSCFQLLTFQSYLLNY